VIRHALAEALGVVEVKAAGPTVDVAGAAELLHCTRRSIYDRRRRGKMPRPINRKPLVWRTADVLAMEP
jgi:hypothetical protein